MEFHLELADIVLRTLYLASKLDIDIQYAVLEKMEENKTRKNKAAQISDDEKRIINRWLLRGGMK